MFGGSVFAGLCVGMLWSEVAGSDRGGPGVKGLRQVDQMSARSRILCAAWRGNIAVTFHESEVACSTSHIYFRAARHACAFSHFRSRRLGHSFSRALRWIGE